MTFGLIYAFSERFILPLSHDEVVYGKGSLLGSMPGDRWQRFANLRAYLGFMWAHPGKKLLFMGGEFAQAREWNHDGELDWHLLDDPNHRRHAAPGARSQRLYRREPALHRRDAARRGLPLVIGDDRANSVFAFLRSGRGGRPPVLVVCNMTPAPRHHYRIGVPRAGLLARDRQHRLALLRRQRHRATTAARPHCRCTRARRAASLDLTLPPLADHHAAAPKADRGGLSRPAAAGHALSARRDVGRARHQLRGVLGQRPAHRPLPVRSVRPAEVARLTLPECTDEVWHGYLPEAQPGCSTAIAPTGRTSRSSGHRFNPHKLLLDPYARRIAGESALVRRVVRLSRRTRRAATSRFDRRDSARAMPKGVVIDDSFNWGDDRPPQRAVGPDTVIYEAHVRGLTDATHETCRRASAAPSPRSPTRT